MQKGQNQSVTRKINLSIIMERYVKHNMSKIDISRHFKLSKPAATNIVTELLNLKLICPVNGSTKNYTNPGVKPLSYCINPNLGVIVILDLSTIEVKVTICNFAGEILKTEIVPDMEIITLDAINKFCKIIEVLLKSPNLSEQNLLCICVAIPCSTNRANEIEYSLRFDIDPKFDLHKFFEEKFNTEIIIKNDVQVYLNAEKNCGLLTNEIKYAILIYIDAGIGGSFYMNGRLEDGENGTAGALGFFPVFSDGNFLQLDDTSSINAIKRNIKFQLNENEQAKKLYQNSLRFRDIKNAYLYENDKLTVSIVNMSAKNVAKALISLIDILNIYYIVINGRIIQLGENYINIIREIIKTKYPTVQINYSALGETAVKEGAIFLAVNKIINNKIDNRHVLIF